MKRQRTLGFKPVSKKVRFFVTMPLTGVLCQSKLTENLKSFPGASPPHPQLGLRGLYAASLAAKMYNTSAKVTFSVGGKNYVGVQKAPGGA